MPKCPACDYEWKASERSVPQIRHYFAMIRAAFANWPEQHQEQFSDYHELRKFLQMEVGHRDLACNMPISGMRKEQAVILATAAIKAAGNFARVKTHKDNLVIWTPKSIAFAKLTHRDACKLFDDVSAQIKEHIGVSGDELLQRQKEVA